MENSAPDDVKYRVLRSKRPVQDITKDNTVAAKLGFEADLGEALLEKYWLRVVLNCCSLVGISCVVCHCDLRPEFCVTRLRLCVQVLSLCDLLPVEFAFLALCLWPRVFIVILSFNVDLAWEICQCFDAMLMAGSMVVSMISFAFLSHNPSVYICYGIIMPFVGSVILMDAMSGTYR